MGNLTSQAGSYNVPDRAKSEKELLKAGDLLRTALRTLLDKAIRCYALARDAIHYGAGFSIIQQTALCAASGVARHSGRLPLEANSKNLVNAASESSQPVSRRALSRSSLVAASKT